MSSTPSEASPIRLGRTVITARAKEALQTHEVLSALWRHAHEPWGKCFDPEDEKSDIRREDRRLVSNHLSSRGQAFRIATETERDLTTVFLRDETDLSDAGLIENWVCHLGCPHCGD
jgi:hypothetical protein